MAEQGNVTVNVQTNINEVEQTLEKMLDVIRGVESKVTETKNKISSCFSVNEAGIKSVETVMSNEVQSATTAIENLKNVIKDNLVLVAMWLETIHNIIRDAVQQQAGGQGIDTADKVISLLNNADEIRTRNASKQKNAGNATPPKDSTTTLNTSDNTSASKMLHLPGPVDPNYKSSSTSSGSGDSSSSGIVSGIMSDMGGLMGGTSIDDMVAGMDTLIGKLKETVGLWAAQTAEKAKSRAEDLKIIAMNTIEHVKAFGKMIAQLAASTAQWIADTAARVGNTAAQWAQVAAMTAWQAICTAATAVTTAFGAAISFLTSPIGLVVIAITALIAIIVLLVKNWDTVSVKAKEVWEFVQAKFQAFDDFLKGVFAKDWTEQFGAFGNVLNALFEDVQNVWDAIKKIFSGIVSFVKNVFAGDWAAAWDSIVQVFCGVWDYLVSVYKAQINGIIGLINSLILGIVGGINAVIGLLNKLKITIPEWVPDLGGATLGFNLKLLNAPQIPYLAKGAVLPANRPFLAVVGDQRHGTNVEAPLSTIQEAVAVVMDDHIAAMMAGFEALLAEQRATRETIEGIQIGDTVIGRAVDRYRSKMAVVYGTGRV